MTLCMVGNFVRETFRDMKAKIAEGNFELMPVMHHLLAGLKAQNTELMMVTIDKARRCCGGAGYQSNSGFTEIHSGASPIPTYEGDNIVMSLQSARYVFKLVKMASKGKKLPFPFQYISNAQALKAMKGKGKSIEEMMDMDILENALAVRALTQIENTATAFATSNANDKAKDNELFARMKLDMIRVHMEYVSMHIFRNYVQKTKIKDARIRDMFDEIFRISCLHLLSVDNGDCFDAGFFAQNANKMMKQAQDKLVAKMRPHLVSMVESIIIHELPSNIGNQYGDIYELQLQQAKDSKLNQLDKANGGVPPQWATHIKPLLHGGQYPKL
jgi:acyl-CoA oxidase